MKKNIFQKISLIFVSVSSMVCRASNIPSLEVEKGSKIIVNNNNKNPKGMTFINPFTGAGDIEVTCTGYPGYTYGCGINLKDKTLHDFPGTLTAGECPPNNQQKIVIISSGIVGDMQAGPNSNTFVLEGASLEITNFTGDIKNTFHIVDGKLNLGNNPVASQAHYNFLNKKNSTDNPPPTLVVNNKTQCDSIETIHANFDPTHYKPSTNSILKLNYNAKFSVSNPNDKKLVDGEKTHIIEVGPEMELTILP